MGKLFDICQQEFERLRPLFAEAADVDLSAVELLTPKEYVRRDVARTPWHFKLQRSFFARIIASKYPAWYGDDLCALSINEEILAKRGIDPALAVAHELGHATEDAIAPGSIYLRLCELHDIPESSKDGFLGSIRKLLESGLDASEWRKCLREFESISPIVSEGFALYFQSHCVDGLDEALLAHTQEMSDALLDSAETGQLNTITSSYSSPWDKILGYTFFRKVADLSGQRDICREILANPPMSVAEIMEPASYLERISSNS